MEEETTLLDGRGAACYLPGGGQLSHGSDISWSSQKHFQDQFNHHLYSFCLEIDLALTSSSVSSFPSRSAILRSLLESSLSSFLAGLGALYTRSAGNRQLNCSVRGREEKPKPCDKKLLTTHDVKAQDVKQQNREIL
jgi:hypothetical protein